ncbi:MAG: hypothetical protein FRC54_08810 [bacterium LCO1.1]|uniref:Transposase n=1 Tax=Candidatus Weimeria bifida TaxID=2599074 RepID=A0A6N7J055_9FIRM|nr:hypothetical protein [Candidatus Weimeria bifida]
MDVNPNEVVKQVPSKIGQIIQERNQSGLTIDEFCKKNGYTRNQYYYYRRKLRRKVIEDSGFVELPQVQSQATAVSEPDIIKKSDHLSGSSILR